MANVFNGIKVSCHIGKGAKKVCQQHNNRTDNRQHTNSFKESHHKEKENLNEYVIDIPLEDFFHQEFDDALNEFNEKQTRKDRIKDFDKYFKDYKKQAYELIVQIGNEDNQPLTDDDYIKAYKDAINTFREKYPSMKVFGAYIHLDETTPHLHLDFLPVADSKRGLSHKVSTDGALESLGFKRTKEDKYAERPFAKFLADIRETMEETVFRKYCPNLVKAELSEREHTSQKEYWRTKLNTDKADLQAEITELEEQKLKASKKGLFNKGMVSISQEEYETLISKSKQLDATTVKADELDKATKRQEQITDNANKVIAINQQLVQHQVEYIEQQAEEKIASHIKELDSQHLRRTNELIDREKALNTNVLKLTNATTIGNFINQKTEEFSKQIERSVHHYGRH